MKTFIATIKDKIAKGETLFYNSKGDKRAFQLCVKHLSSAVSLGYAILIQETLYILKPCLLVDFQSETVSRLDKGDKLTVTELKEL